MQLFGKLTEIEFCFHILIQPAYILSRSNAARIPDLAREALTRLGVEIVPSTLQRQYMEGKHNQVMNGRLFGTTSRITRRIGYDGFYTSYERFAG